MGSWTEGLKEEASSWLHYMGYPFNSGKPGPSLWEEVHNNSTTPLPYVIYTV